jgi:hypothetical protein
MPLKVPRAWAKEMGKIMLMPKKAKRVKEPERLVVFVLHVIPRCEARLRKRLYDVEERDVDSEPKKYLYSPRGRVMVTVTSSIDKKKDGKIEVKGKHVSTLNLENEELSSLKNGEIIVRQLERTTTLISMDVDKLVDAAAKATPFKKDRIDFLKEIDIES